MKNKKAQLKIQQMAFMIIAVTLFFVLVGIAVLVFTLSGMMERTTELQEENAMLLVTKLANSPEFSCGGDFYGESDCIDSDKVMMLKENIEKYKKFWGVSDIEIKKIYPESEEEILCEISNYPDCNTIRLVNEEVEGTYLSNFVSLCRKELSEGRVYNKCEIARLMISYKGVK
jgi:hypothetical protein